MLSRPIFAVTVWFFPICTNKKGQMAYSGLCASLFPMPSLGQSILPSYSFSISVSTFFVKILLSNPFPIVTHYILGGMIAWNTTAGLDMPAG